MRYSHKDVLSSASFTRTAMIKETDLEIEPIGENTTHCACCGKDTRNIWGDVYQHNGGQVADYSVQWVVGASLAEHPARFEIVLGVWGEDTTADDRYSVALIDKEDDNGRSVVVVDANGRSVATSYVAGAALTRNEVVGTPLAAKVFAVFAAVVDQDDRLY